MRGEVSPAWAIWMDLAKMGVKISWKNFPIACTKILFGAKLARKISISKNSHDKKWSYVAFIRLFHQVVHLNAALQEGSLEFGGNI